MLAFLPWLRIKESIRSGPFHLFQQSVGDVPPDGVASAISPATMAKVLSQYRDSSNVPLRVVPVLQYDGRSLGTDFDDVDRAAIFRFGQHLAVSGMSNRRFIGGFLDGYTAAGHYQVVIQAFVEPYNGSVSLTHRRKGGHSSVLLGQTDVHFVRPAHLASQGEPTINLTLLAALQAIHTLPKPEKGRAVHEHIDASVTQFLLANSDSPDVPLEAESIATYAALERVSDSDQSLNDIRRKLPEILALAESPPWTAWLRDELELPAGAERPVLSAWLKQVYKLRGNVAHGKPADWQPNDWTQQEHHVAGAFIYPLVLKCLLAKHGLYSLSEEDVAWVLGLDGLLLDRPFYEVPPTVEGGAAEVDDDAEPTPLPRRTDLVRWQLQFQRINEALATMSLSATIRETMENIEARESGGTE